VYSCPPTVTFFSTGSEAVETSSISATICLVTVNDADDISEDISDDTDIPSYELFSTSPSNRKLEFGGAYCIDQFIEYEYEDKAGEWDD
jgi:hypothetical protein